ncbi:hypothetical protein [Thalassobacillus hwangdonensis]|uniref:Lipoprotein n=1 Tax=Thalassobacillus hwangdonensis TaxID=546108 RepID=A0ABW3L2D6_9BACI
MILRKKWAVMVAALTAILLLAACGDKGKAEQPTGEESTYDNPRNHTAEDFMPISEGFEEYSVWIETAESPVRDSNVNKVFVFNKGKVTVYQLEDTTIEDIHDLSDDELVQLASEYTNKTLDELADTINNIAISETINEKHGGVVEDIYLEFEGGERSTLSSNYTLDITMDELGQNTKDISLHIPEASYQLSSHEVTEYEASGFTGAFFDYYTYTTDPNYNHTLETYSRPLEILETYGTFKEKDGHEMTDPPHPQTYVPDPIVWETTDEEITLEGNVVHQKIFDTTFSGIKTSNRGLFTRVDDSFVGFRLDNPDTDKENVTIEGK